MKKNKLIALFAGLSLAFVGSAALAAPSADTLLVAGYDSDQMAVLYGISGIDQATDTEATLDCTLVGEYVYETGDAIDGQADVETLTADPENEAPAGDTTFEAETVVEDEDAPTDVTYNDLYASTDQDGKDCLLTSVTIERKGNGEISHGSVVSTFAHLLGPGKGCLMRHFAQSDFGKADYDEPQTDTFEVTLQSILTSCDKQKGKGQVQTADGEDAGQGGKANAPGQTKQKPAKGKDHAPGQKKKSDS